MTFADAGSLRRQYAAGVSACHAEAWRRDGNGAHHWRNERRSNATHSLAGADGARLIAALEGLARSIERSTEVTSEQRAAANEIVADTITAAKPEKPNAAKVAGTLGRFREHQALL
jgi:hypothetical protein